MQFKTDYIMPILVICGLLFLFGFNNKTPTISNNGNVIIQPKKDVDLIRTLDNKDSVENDNRVIISHKASGDKFEFLIQDGYVLLPDGVTKLPTKMGADGKEHQTFEITTIKKEYIFDPGWDFGTYAGFIDGNKEGTNVKDFDVGIRFSPIKIWNTFSPDILISSQDIGMGISFYPMPLRYGNIWHHIGLGVGKVIDYDVKDYHNLFYVSFSTRF